ncbi:MAG: class I mannose-6-phosphate isomerase [Acidobacteriaceae bacterium]|nr:class I mannose-6-phosphate isomerase [Acidobacteriaceae bacterium]
MRSQFDLHPAVPVAGSESECASGWREILDQLQQHRGAHRIAIECYPGVALEPLRQNLVACLKPDLVLESADAMLSPQQVEAKFAAILGDDPVFGRMTPVLLNDYFDQAKLDCARSTAERQQGRVIAIGTGATLLMPSCDLLIYVDVARWEIQQRQRRHEAPSIGLENANDSPGELYKRAFFLDWRAADQRRHEIYNKVDFWIDGNLPQQPMMLSGTSFRAALAEVSRRPFCLVPFFDPGPWGGQWMRRKFSLPDGPPNYAWCFNCVPEENSLALRFGSRVFELQSQTLVHEHPQELLGDIIYRKLGAEFPIRFDFLDTMEGGNLSLQVHPLRSYIAEQFGLTYTQDESYYMMDAGPDGTVYLGLRTGVDPQAMADDLRLAQTGAIQFPADKYVNVWPARKHDHFLIPGGTVHCSGRNGMVLEISATPYIFTFKLWDWGRLGLDGRPRPIHIDHGLKNIQWNRTTEWVRENLVHQNEAVAAGDGWREERTGLHALEFIETRRHWFTAPVPHDTEGNLNVLNLVEGDAAIVESPTDAFAPLTVHYAETFVIPAAVGPYRIRPAAESKSPLATIKAYVREGA